MTTKGERKAPARYAGLCKVSGMNVPGASVFPNSSTSFFFFNTFNFPCLPPPLHPLLQLKPEMYAQYTQLHDHTWDEVCEKMYKANMRNFVVYVAESPSSS